MPRPEAVTEKLWEMAEEGDIRAAECVIGQVDGKVLQPTLNADLERMKGMTAESWRLKSQIEREIAKLQGELDDEELAAADQDAGKEVADVSDQASATNAQCASSERFPQATPHC